jgi:hypothetical protein
MPNGVAEDVPLTWLGYLTVGVAGYVAGKLLERAVGWALWRVFGSD